MGSRILVSGLTVIWMGTLYPTDFTKCRICLYLKDRGDERCAGVDPGPRVVREQGPVPVIQSNIALVHAVNGADKGGDDDEDPDD